MIVIGITGTLGSGKGTIVDYLVSKKGFEYYSVRAYLIEIIRKKGLPVNRDSMVVVANDLRKQNSPSFIIDELYKQAVEIGKNCIIESIRTVGEIESLRQKGSFFLFAVDADPRIRYQRIFERRSETDMIDYETFLENEKREMRTRDPNKQNLQKCIKKADFVLNNNGSFEDLHRQIDEILLKIEL